MSCSSCKNSNNNNNNKKFSKKQRNPHFNASYKTIFPNDVIPDLSKIKVFYPKDSLQETVLNLGKENANRYVLYYCSSKKSLVEYNTVKMEKNAYGKLQNHGISKTDKEGKATIKFRCPQIYKEGGKAVLPHIHYILTEKGNKKWIHKLEIEQVVCDITHQELKDMIKNKCALILNALPIEYYIKDHIPMSIPLPHDLVLDKLNEKEVKKYISEMLPHASVIYKSVKKGKMNLLNIPIISYCYSPTCDADNDLQRKLIKIGFKNVKTYSLGIQGYRKLEGK
tara:strand:- start:1162 stop:2004 length:843 start_codon:yes stop_codon:yes gene_type:complete